MKKRLYFALTILFTTILSLTYFSITYLKKDREKYFSENINGVVVKGDTTKYKVKFIKKIDGDTIKVYFNNKELTIRYLLIDTPETVKKNTPVEKYGKEASELNEKILKNAKNVEIEFDVMKKRDKYNRALCYVYADSKLVQEEILLNGFGVIKYVYPPDTRYLKKLRKAEEKAKNNKLNLWSE